MADPKVKPELIDGAVIISPAEPRWLKDRLEAMFPVVHYNALPERRGVDHDDHDTWTITTQPSRLAHYAMWPAKLAERLVLSMCPEWVCSTCGEPPRRRIERATNRTGVGFRKTADDTTRLVSTLSPARTELETLGWTDCGHDAYAPGVVLDPFAGTGTTLAVADLHGRHGIGFDIDARNAQLMDARRAEVARNLFGTTPEIPGQLDIFDSTA